MLASKPLTWNVTTFHEDIEGRRYISTLQVVTLYTHSAPKNGKKESIFCAIWTGILIAICTIGEYQLVLTSQSSHQTGRSIKKMEEKKKSGYAFSS